MGRKLTLATDSGTTRRMGRPPLKRNTETVVTTIRLSADVAQRIDDLAGPNKRGEWIRRVITKELRKVTTSPPNAPGSRTSKDAE